MPDFTVRQYGTDSSGRAIWLTAYMADWWETVVAALGFRPAIVQGAFMVRNGGGADASAGYHDAAGCLDLRLWDLSPAQQEQMVREIRRSGAAAWRRDEAHGGMDPHCHIVLGTDVPLASGAAQQWRDYVQGLDGLASRGRDYEWRPAPLVLTPPEDIVTPEDIDKIATLAAQKVLAAKVEGGSPNLTVALVLKRLGKAFDVNGTLKKP